MGGFYEISIEDERYPQRLREIYQPPKVLYCMGNIELLKKPMVSVVGSRNCSEYGKSCAFELGKTLSQNGITTVSGMALGIDTFAHRGGISSMGSTIAIMANGIEGCYPPSNRDLREEILRNGLLISENREEYIPRRYDFPKRNRIISGISETTVVIEAGERSGSLITAEFALEQNRNVFALPGNITSQYSQGTNRLIKEGATPLVNFNDIVYELGIIPQRDSDLKVQLGEDEKTIYDLVNRWGEVSKSYLTDATGFAPKKVSGLLVVLEIKGLIKSSLGKIYIAK